MLKRLSNPYFQTALVIFAFLPLCMDLTILHVSAPSLSRDFGADGVQILWIIDIYALITGSLLIPFGTLADRIGSKKMLLAGLSLFALASLGASFAPGASWLIFFRALMGFGAAMIVPSTVALIRQLLTTPKEIATGYGYWSAAASGGAAAGPVIGGFLISHFFSGSVFLINVFILAPMIPLLWKALPELPVKESKYWPIGQGVLMGLGTLLVVYSVKEFGKGHAGVWLPFSALVLGCILLYWFWQLQKHSGNPMLDFSLFRIKPILFGMITALAVVSCLSGVEYTLAQELQFVFGLSPLAAGVFMLPLMIGSCIASPCTGSVITRFSLGGILSSSLVLAALGLFGLGMIEIGEQRLLASVFLTLIGCALGIGLTASSTGVMNFAPKGKAGSAGALEGVGYDLGSGLGIAAFGTFLANAYASFLELPSGLPPVTAKLASGSISDTFIAAQSLNVREAELLTEAAKTAFLPAHTLVLVTVAAIFVLLAIPIWRNLKTVKVV